MSSRVHVLHRTPLGAAAVKPAAAPRGLVRRVVETIVTWRARARDRRELAALNHRALRDMGLDSADVQAEVTKPFWIP